MIAQDTDALRLAAKLGLERVELCQGLALGGLTPSVGLIEAAVAVAAVEGERLGRAPVEVHVLVRPRSGGFVYSAAELDVILGDIRAAVHAGAAGVVVGSQLATGELDAEALAQMVAAAAGAAVSLHRVIDVTPDPVAALETAIAAGVGRVLTSGGQSRAIDGAATLAAMVSAAAGRIEIMAGGGVNAQSAAALVATGVDAIHFSAKRDVIDRPPVQMGSGETDGVYEVADAELAAAITAIVRG